MRNSFSGCWKGGYHTKPFTMEKPRCGFGRMLRLNDEQLDGLEECAVELLEESWDGGKAAAHRSLPSARR